MHESGSQTQKLHIMQFHLDEMFGIGKSIETESRLSGHWGWKKREWRVTANRYGVNLGALKCSRISGDSCTSYELYTLKG